MSLTWDELLPLLAVDAPPEPVLAALAGSSERERKALAAPIATLLGEREYRDDGREAHRQALTVAAFCVAGSAGWLVRAVRGTWFDGGDVEAVADVLAARRPPWLAKLPAQFMRSPGRTFFPWWRLTRTLVRRELVARPDDPAYTVAAVHSATDFRTPPHNPNAVLAQDPGLIDDVVWSWFRTEEAGRSLTTHDGYVHPRGEPHVGTWGDALVAATADGRIDRGRLLDETLHTLSADHRDVDLTWFADLHELLAPSDDELAARAARYLGLLTVGYGRAVAIALAAAGRLLATEGLDVPAFLDAVPTALVRKEKKAPLAALRLLGRLMQRPEHRDAAACCAARAFEHRDAAVQDAAWDLIEPVLAELSPATRARIADAAETAAPSVASRLTALRDAPTAAPEPASSAPSSPAAPFQVHPFPAPIDDAEELAREFAALLDGAESAIALERVLDATARFAARPTDELRPWLKPLVERHDWREVLAADDVWRVQDGRGAPYNLRFWLAELVCVLAEPGQDILDWLPDGPAGTVRQLVHFAFGPSPHGLLVARIHELAAKIRWGEARPLLATPTGLDGSIDERTYRERLAALRAAGQEPWPADGAQARLRLRGPGRILAIPYVGRTAQGELGRLLDRPKPSRQLSELAVTATGLDPTADAELLLALAGRYAEGRKAVEAEFTRALDYGRWDRNRGGPLWAWLTPAEPDLVLARWLPLFNQEAATRSASGQGIMPALDWLVITDRYDGALVPKCLALALGAGRADARLLAAELVAAAIGDGRLAPDRLAAAIREQAGAGVLKLSRVADAVRLIGATDGDAAWRLLVAALPLLLVDRPRDTATLLTVACDLATGRAAELPDEVRQLAAERGTTRLQVEARRLARVSAG